MRKYRQFTNGGKHEKQKMDLGDTYRASYPRGTGRRGQGGFTSPLFGLVKLAVLAALLWLGFNFIRNSGRRLTRTAPQPAPAFEDKKDEA